MHARELQMFLSKFYKECEQAQKNQKKLEELSFHFQTEMAKLASNESFVRSLSKKKSSELLNKIQSLRGKNRQNKHLSHKIFKVVDESLLHVFEEVSHVNEQTKKNEKAIRHAILERVMNVSDPDVVLLDNIIDVMQQHSLYHRQDLTDLLKDKKLEMDSEEFRHAITDRIIERSKLTDGDKKINLSHLLKGKSYLAQWLKTPVRGVFSLFPIKATSYKKIEAADNQIRAEQVYAKFKAKHSDKQNIDRIKNTPLRWLHGSATDYDSNDLVEMRKQMGHITEHYLLGDRYRWSDYYSLPPASESQKELEEKACDGDVVAMAMLGKRYYDSGNKSLAYQYFDIAIEASKNFDIEQKQRTLNSKRESLFNYPHYNNFLARNIPYVIANSIADPDKRMQYHCISIARGGVESLHYFRGGSTFRVYERLHGMIALANYFINLPMEGWPNSEVEKGLERYSKIKNQFKNSFNYFKNDKHEANQYKYKKIMNVFLQYSDDHMRKISKFFFGDDSLFNEVKAFSAQQRESELKPNLKR